MPYKDKAKQAERDRRYYKANRGRIIARNTLWRKTHYAQHYESNRENIAAHNKAYYASNRDKEKARIKKFRLEHPEYVEKCRASRNKRYAEDPEYRTRRISLSRKWEAEHPEKIKAKREEEKRRFLHDPEYRKQRQASKRNYKLKRKYGINQAQYDEMFERQSGVCAICGKPQISGKKLAIDHNHKTGQVRGLLCRKCNLSIGHLNDDAGLFYKAAQYLSTR